MTALTSTVLACSLKPLDIAFMKAAHYKVNIVPVIAKADTLTKLEVQKLKKKVLISLYLFILSSYLLGYIATVLIGEQLHYMSKGCVCLNM